MKLKRVKHEKARANFGSSFERMDLVYLMMFAVTTISNCV
jgi:hypothetical protein